MSGELALLPYLEEDRDLVSGLKCSRRVAAADTLLPKDEGVRAATTQ